MTAPKAAKPNPPLYDRLNSLLHTMRCIELHEPELCALLQELKTARKVTPKLVADLRTVLDRLPAEAYTEDLAAVEHALNS